jgi:hypothetical protein
MSCLEAATSSMGCQREQPAGKKCTPVLGKQTFLVVRATGEWRTPPNDPITIIWGHLEKSTPINKIFYFQGSKRVMENEILKTQNILYEENVKWD